MNIEIIRYRLPVYWVGVLINDDWTGLSDEEAQEVDDFVKHADGCPVGVDWGTDCYSHWSVRAESIMSVIKRFDNGKSAEVYDIDELKNNWNHWVRTGEILFTPGNGRW